MRELKNKQIVVTGGCGFIGSRLVYSLHPSNNITVIDDLSTGDSKRIQEDLVRMDIRENIGRKRPSSRLIKLLEDNDVVFHLAGQTNIPHSLQFPVDDVSRNLLGTVNLLDACRQGNTKLIVFSSTSSVYGKAEQIPISETCPLNPLTLYALSKKCCEDYIRMFHETHGIRYVILRYFNVYGENGRGVISSLIKGIKEKRKIFITGEGKMTKDFIHVGDVVKANILAALRNWAGEYNIGTGKETSIREVIEILRQIRNFEVERKASRKCDIVSRSCAKIEKAMANGFRPKVKLDEYLRMKLE